MRSAIQGYAERISALSRNAGALAKEIITKNIDFKKMIAGDPAEEVARVMEIVVAALVKAGFVNDAVRLGDLFGGRLVKGKSK